jgi:hypothetical protein
MSSLQVSLASKCTVQLYRLVGVSLERVWQIGSHVYSTTAFVLSLIGGIIIVAGGLISLLFYLYGWPYHGGMMGGWGWMMGGYGYFSGFTVAFSIMGLVSGIIVVVGALMLNARPAEHRAWAVMILVFSIASLLGMDGFFMGALLGIAGGAMALAYRPPFKKET